MSNYYKEIIDDIKKCINDGELDQALFLIRKELEMPYIPNEIEQELLVLQREIRFKSGEDESNNEISDQKLLNMLKGKEMSQLQAVNHLTTRNLRLYVEELKDYLSKDPSPEAAALLIDALAEQEISDEFTYTINGVEYTFWPDSVTPVTKSEGFKEGLKYLNEVLGKEPSLLEMVKTVFINHLYLSLPLSIDAEESHRLIDDFIVQVREMMN